jgi:hypothetical protein
MNGSRRLPVMARLLTVASLAIGCVPVVERQPVAATRVADAGPPSFEQPVLEAIKDMKPCRRDADCPPHFACACADPAACTFVMVIGEEPDSSGDNVCLWLRSDYRP